MFKLIGKKIFTILCSEFSFKYKPMSKGYLYSKHDNSLLCELAYVKFLVACTCVIIFQDYS